MALTLEDWGITDYLQKVQAEKPTSKWYVGALKPVFLGEHRECEDRAVAKYEWMGKIYKLIYEWRTLTWTTPAGEIRPCINKTRLLVSLELPM